MYEYLYYKRMRPRTYILEEDEHLNNLRKIIKRDFFKEDGEESLPMSLDNYLANFKSNENKIFAELVEADKEKFKKQHWWLEQKDKLLMLESQKKEQKPYHNMLQKDPQLNGIDQTVKQKQKNELFFYQEKEKKSRLSDEHHKAKKIITENCFLNTQENIKIKEYKKKPKINYDLLQVPETPVLQGKNSDPKFKGQYPLVRAPSPQPEAIPLMTWGQIESTPQRLSGSEYVIPQTPQRDLLLEKLNAKIVKQKTQKVNRKNEMMMKLQSSMRPLGSNYRKSSVRRVSGEDQKGKTQNDFTSLLKIQKK